ncbi:hypothetical protein SBOR_9011 [Sclerotinia borealis F-4128]|uniref:Glucose-methanol-choline oxidoreductase N-terminal domain-containing protein n=1 Tax=Sclerotinia borealis (strain F-4128) TaxID=1432307 RepID=W9C4G1_SCLBF|nr:hypothetical protein SBOR_9011 [Sclerotinia borealis F-4128]
MARLVSFVLLIAIFQNVASHPVFSGRVLERSTDLLPTYDYVIVGGGTSGLVVANRLSENQNTTVLVIEAGSGPRNTIYDYNTTSTPQPHLHNRTLPLSAGKVIGGSSAINGMVYMRGNAAEYNHWEALGNPGWNWEGLLPYFKKSENYTPANQEEVEEWGIGYDEHVHGEGGFVQNGFPRFVWPSTKNFLSAFLSLGITYIQDSLSGLNTGVFFFLLSITPSSQQRSTSQSFLPPNSHLAIRPNLHILTSHTVTQILFSSPPSHSHSHSHSSSVSASAPPPPPNSTTTSKPKPRATAVEYASGENTTRHTIHARHEIILTAGAQRTPQLLLISGIGRRDVLEELGIEVVVESEGVGENYQDHLLFVTSNPAPNIEVQYGNLSTNATWAAEMRKLYDEKREGPFTTTSANIFSFLPLATIINSTSLTPLHNTLQPHPINLTQYHLPSTPPTVLTGYTHQHQILTWNLLSPNTSHIELIIGDTIIAPALQLPFSRGRVTISTRSSFSPPLLHPNYLSHPQDLLQLTLAFNYTRVLRHIPSLTAAFPPESYPGPNITSQMQIEEFLRETVVSENHHVGTASMMPREWGGVVDERLRVYGVQGVRVLDASVVPMLVAAHMQATVYGVAEKGAAMILEDACGVWGC